MSYTNGLDKPDDYFNTILYTGNGSSQSITGVGFQPDLLWIKSRGLIGNHFLSDIIRGSTKRLKSNATDTEDTITSLSSFDSDGFTLSNTGYNGSGETFVVWNWLASNTTASNTDGSITSTVSANTVAGFSIVKYTGTGAIGTVGHGLGVAPKMIIAKGLAVDNNWIVYHSTVGNTKGLALQDTTDFTGSHLFNNTSPTSSVFSLGAVGATNSSGDENIAYCFAEKKGYSKFGSYTGNGNADGTFVYTGMKPSFVMVKQTNASGEGWHILDNKRSGANGDMERLLANSSNAESNYSGNLDLLSNGFKTRINDAGVNGSGSTYIYMAFAENPFVTSSGVPACAR